MPNISKMRIGPLGIRMYNPHFPRQTPERVSDDRLHPCALTVLIYSEGKAYYSNYDANHIRYHFALRSCLTNLAERGKTIILACQSPHATHIGQKEGAGD